MLTTEHPWNSTVETKSSPTYELRLHGGTEDPRLITVPWGKHSIGSGPRCSIRLTDSGVQPLECLIVHDDSGLRVRRWNDNTTLNGQPFDDARLAAGDVLTIGPLELEVTAPQEEMNDSDSSGFASEAWDSEPAPAESETSDLEEQQTEEDEAPAVSESYAEHAFELSPQVLQPTDAKLGWEASESDQEEVCGSEQEGSQPAEEIAATSEADDSIASETESAQPRSAPRRGGRRVRAALHRQRKQYDLLIARIGDLERKLDQALSEPAATTKNSAEPPDSSHDESAALERDQRQVELESQLTQSRDQLAGRDRDLQQARYSIDVLERQLIDSQRTIYAFAEERLTWESQFDELEARLADYVGRIQDLERQLDGAGAVQTEEVPSAVTPNVEWAAESETEQAPNVSEDVTETVSDAADDTSIAEVATREVVVEEPVAEEVAPVEIAEVAPPQDPVVAETTSEEGPEVDAALDHLRGLSIWREEPQTASESSVEEPPQAAEASPPPAPSTPPASFIDRYAHLFPSDDAPADSLVQPVEPVRHVPPPAREAVPEQGASGHEEEESVEQYMAKLLERMRGPASSDTAVETDAIEEDEPSETDSQSTADDETTVAPEPITDLSELKTKPTVAEQASHRQAMRELAMESARHAIGVHAARKLRRSMRTRSVIALLGAAVASYLLITAPGWQSLQFAAACVAGFVALYWGKLTLSTILEGIRLGAFEDHDEEVDADNSIHPPLPIDVEPARQSEPELAAPAVEHAEPESTSDAAEHAVQS